ncbi:hypothetical protein Tco_0634051 [Tanacetum coccineum]
MTSLKIRNSPAYKTFLAYATGAIPSKKARKFKKPASSSKKKTLVAVEEPVKKSAKKPATRIQSAGVQIGDTHGVSVSKKKAPTKAKRSKGVKLMSEAPLLEEAQLEKAIKRSKQETNIHHACGSSEGAGFRTRGVITDVSKADSSESEYESWGDSDDDVDQQSDDEQTLFDNQRTSDDKEETQEDKFVHTPENYVPTDDETNDINDEEYDRINEEMYSDVNVELKDIELEGEGKDDKEMIDVGHVDQTRETIKSKVTIVVKEYLRTSLDDALHKQQKPQKSAADIRKIKIEMQEKQQETKYTITLSDMAELQEFDQKRTLFETMTKTKSFNKNTKYKALYHALMESILEDENAMDKGVADKSKKRKPDDADRDESYNKSQPKPTGKSAQAEETLFVAGDTQVPQNLGEDIGNSDEPPVVNVDPNDWFKKPERPPTLDPEWNDCKTVDNKSTQKWLSDLAKAEQPSKTLNDLMRTSIDFNAFAMNHLQISDLT